MVRQVKRDSNYAKVKELTDKIISSKKFELYDDYYNLFKIPGKLCNESLFECQCTDFGNGSGDMVDADQWFVFQGPANNGNISGWGFIGLYKEFRDWAAARGEGIRATTSFLLAGSTTPSGDVIRPLQNPTQTDCWNGKAYTPSNQLTEGRTKYGSNNNLRLYRFAETLLNAAELLLQTGGSAGEAAQYVTRVRERAGLQGVASVTVNDIIEERHLEFVGEGKRYFDLVRSGLAATTLVPDKYGYRTNSWTENKKHIPLAQSELDADPTLKPPTKPILLSITTIFL